MALGCLSASAQDQAPKTEYVFNPHWYVQAQFGGQYTLGESCFESLLSPNAQIGVGYNFSKLFGARLSVNSWKSKGGIETDYANEKWHWNYIAPMIDVTMNLSNAFCGYNPTRLVNVSIFGGIGANIGFKNDQANEVANVTYPVNGGNGSLSENVAYAWTGTKTRFVGRAGVNVDFRITDNWSAGLEVNANVLNDHYNSKRAGNADWYFNALVGVKYNFGKTYTTREIPCCKPQIVEKVVEKVVEKPVPVVQEVKKEVEKKEVLRRDIFYTISSVQIPASEQSKVKEIADYLKKYPEAKVTVTGYADKGTGSTAINNRLANNRANTVVNALVNQYGISKSRIVSSSKGDSEQPYSENAKNRVAICIAE